MTLHGTKCGVRHEHLAPSLASPQTTATGVTASKLLHIAASLERERNGAVKTRLSSAIGIPTCEF